ncbi:unnamed protein product [Rotaria sp. Silwood1]|nr:unnamed protein product [Rotaria sp. Silwood1]CAF3605661.1 unnamed protein product [Rotaria sp. Silwood1]CAF4981005.1 unnamed protein product [Rotaria sp. Silwood1]
MNNSNMSNLSKLPDNVLTLKGDEFYKFVQSVAGEPLYDILKIQSINSTQSFLDTDDIFEIFKYDSPDLIEIKRKSCFKINGEYVVKAGIKNSSTYLITLLKTKQQTLINNSNDSNNNPRQMSNELLNNNPLLKSLINWSKNNYQYSDSVKRFALLLYILGGKLTYELVRINLVGALPHLSTLNKLISSTGLSIRECEFQFDN